MVLGFPHGTTTSRRQRGLELSGYSAWLDAAGKNGGGLRTQNRQAVFNRLGQGQISGNGAEGDFAEGEMTQRGEAFSRKMV